MAFESIREKLAAPTVPGPDFVMPVPSAATPRLAGDALRQRTGGVYPIRSNATLGGRPLRDVACQFSPFKHKPSALRGEGELRGKLAAVQHQRDQVDSGEDVRVLGRKAHELIDAINATGSDELSNSLRMEAERILVDIADAGDVAIIYNALEEDLKGSAADQQRAAKFLDTYGPELHGLADKIQDDKLRTTVQAEAQRAESLYETVIDRLNRERKQAEVAAEAAASRRRLAAQVEAKRLYMLGCELKAKTGKELANWLEEGRFNELARSGGAMLDQVRELAAKAGEWTPGRVSAIVMPGASPRA
jgi:hypothetical protein